MKVYIIASIDIGTYETIGIYSSYEQSYDALQSYVKFHNLELTEVSSNGNAHTYKAHNNYMFRSICIFPLILDHDYFIELMEAT